nr:hypothetical protein [uncultured Rhodopila sp.]
MSALTLLLLTLDMVTLLVVGTMAVVLPAAAGLFLTAGLSAFGALLCLPPLLLQSSAGLIIPAGPPGLHLHLALGPMPAFFLLLILLGGAAIAAFQATARTRAAPKTAVCLSGTILSLLAADGVTLLLGSALMCGAVFPDWNRRRGLAVLLVPLLLFGAVCLLTPAGFAPRFDAIRAAPVGVDRASIAAVMSTAAIAGLICLRPQRGNHALAAGAVLPAGIAILIRLTADLSGQTVQAWWGVVLLAAGGGIAVLQAWRAAADAGIDDAVGNLVRRQAGLMMMGAGLALIAHAADLVQAQSVALQATMMLAVDSVLAGTVATLAAEAMAASAGTVRLSRLGGLIHTMPWTSAALAAGLIALSALPPGLGFAALWLLFQALLSAPRTAALPDQVPLALAALAIALSAAAATSAAVRIAGIAVLGRPRTPAGAGAPELARSARTILSALAALAVIAGLFPGPVIRALAAPAVRGLSGSSAGIRGGLTMLSTSAASPGYAALSVAALLAFATGCVILVLRWRRREGKAGSVWFGGMKPPVNLPFGEPMAQSAGAGFLPGLPDLPGPPRLLHRRHYRGFPRLSPGTIPAAAALWLVFAAFAILLLAVSVTGAGA